MSFDFNKDYELELISNPEWCEQVLEGIRVLKAFNCYTERNTAGAWGMIKFEGRANWNETTMDVWHQLNTVYRWLKTRFENHEVTVAIANYLEEGWWFLQGEYARQTPNKPIKLTDLCYLVFDGITLYKIQNDGEWDSLWITTSNGNFVSKHLTLEEAIKFAQWL
jgi:hypothetical protein